MTEVNNIFQNISLVDQVAIDGILISLSKVIGIERPSWECSKNDLFYTENIVDNSEVQSQAKSVSESIFSATANSQANAVAIGLENINKISTGRDNDSLIGVANASAFSESLATSKITVILGNNSAIANSESIAVANILAIGIDNLGAIATGNGNDRILGVASTSADSQAEAIAFASNIAALSTECDSEVVNQIEKAISKSTSTTIANSKTSTFGIFNSGEIFTGQGDDVIFGLANTKSFSNSQAIAEAESIANDIAIATAKAESIAITESDTVGIVNTGAIATGRGNDIIVGIAVNNVAATADAKADTVSIADNPDSQTDTNSIADTSTAISIGIDNTSGVIKTSEGDDRVIGYGAIGIKGGNIETEKGNDRIIAYGSNIGVEDSEIKLGQGDDYFQAAIVDFNQSTQEVYFQEDQSGSIKNAAIFGDRGNDTFDIGGFEATVSINGGKDYDALKLWGNISDYQITLGSSGNQALTIEDADSMLIVENVEAFYFGNSDRVYSFSDFA